MTKTSFRSLILTNLSSFKKADCAFFFLAVPAILILIYLLPPELKAPLILYPNAPTLPSIFFMNYVHIDPWHLFDNLLSYFIALLIIFLFDNNKKRFHMMSIFLLLIMPFIASYYSIEFIGKLLPNAPFFGFSAISYGYWGYAMYALIRLAGTVIGNTKASAIFFGIVILLLVSILLQNPISGSSFINIPAHYVGFLLGALVPYIVEGTKELYDQRRRKYKG